MNRLRFAWILCTIAACSEIAGLGDERTHADDGGVDGSLPDAASGAAGTGGSSAGSGGVGGSNGGAAGSTGGVAGSAGGAGGSTGGVGGVAGSAGADAGIDAASDAETDASPDACGANLDDDPQNCGQCGHDCLGGDCVGGECQAKKLLSSLHGGYDIACTGSSVFWTNQMFGGVHSMSTLTLSPQSWSPFAGPTHISSAGATVYFASPGHDAVYEVPATGLQAPSQHWPAPQALTVLAADATGVYFDGPGAIYVTDGSQQTLVASSIEQPNLLALDSGFVYFSSTVSGAVFRVPKAGPSTAPAPLHSTGASATRAITVDALYVYFATWPGNGEVLRKNKDGSGAPQTIATGQSGVFDMVRAGPYLYWVNTGTSAVSFKDGSVRRARVDGATPGAIEPVASSLEFSRGICADASAVYWVTRGLSTPEPQTESTVWRQAL